MTTKSLFPEAVQTYIDDVTTKRSDTQSDLAAYTAALPEAEMQTGHDQTVLLSILVRAMGVRKALEIGVFTGYSGLAIASAMAPGGRLVACDVSEEWTSVARDHWRRAGVDERIDLRIAPALETLRALEEAGEGGTFDFAYIDADKGNYEAYYESCLSLVRRDGLIALDNIIWSGEAAQTAPSSETAQLLRELALKIGADARVETCLLGIADGLLLARKI